VGDAISVDEMSRYVGKSIRSVNVPVVGHALAGLAVAAWSDGSQRVVGPESFSQRVLIFIGLSYIPDIATQLAVIAGFRSASIISHSLIFAVGASVVLAPVIARATALSGRQAAVLVVFMALLHDGMDILQSPGRMPLWPIPFVVDIGEWIPATLQGEVLVSLPCVLVALTYQWWKRGFRVPARYDWVSVIAIVSIVASASIASEMRDERERDLIRGRALAESGQYQAALEACAMADRWPSTAAPGRIDYVRAMSWWGLGRIDLAEELYLRSYDADPGYIWAVADLVAMYASSRAPHEERSRKAERWLAILRERFRGHPALPGLTARVERNLAESR
jgi:hypothetical protein